MASSLNQILLPFDLIEEILSAIPIEYLLHFRHLICKEWYSLFKNKRFIYKYLDSTEQRFIRIDNMVQIIDPVTQTRINSPLPGGFPCKPFISTMVHCDGLVLLKFNSRELGPRTLLIWNPILGQFKWIQPTRNFHPYIRNFCIFSHYSQVYNGDTYGIGYDNAARDDHKIIRFYNRVYNGISERYDEIEIEIYDLKSNSWKFLETTCDWSVKSSYKGVSVIGNMYWMARRWIDNQMFIQSFDFSTETFKPRSTLPFQRHRFDTIAFSCFKRDKLALLHQFAETKKIEIWVSNKMDEEVMSWSKYLSVDSPLMPKLYASPGFFIDKNDKIRCWCENETQEESAYFNVSIYEFGKDGIKKEEKRLRFNPYRDYICSFLSEYIPSLVPLPLPQ